jgi:hypothetical protein
MPSPDAAPHAAPVPQTACATCCCLPTLHAPPHPTRPQPTAPSTARHSTARWPAPPTTLPPSRRRACTTSRCGQAGGKWGKRRGARVQGWGGLRACGMRARAPIYVLAVVLTPSPRPLPPHPPPLPRAPWPRTSSTAVLRCVGADSLTAVRGCGPVMRSCLSCACMPLAHPQTCSLERMQFADQLRGACYPLFLLPHPIQHYLTLPPLPTPTCPLPHASGHALPQRQHADHDQCGGRQLRRRGASPLPCRRGVPLPFATGRGVAVSLS